MLRPNGNRNSLGSTQYEDPYYRNLDHGACDTDLRQNFNNSVVYETPKFFASRLADHDCLDTGRSGALITLHTGFPFNPLTGVER